MILLSFFTLFNSIFLVYGVVLFVVYVLIALLSTYELTAYLKRNRHFRYNRMKSYKELPSVSVIAPAFNEEKSIVENIRSLLSLQYPRMEVIIVNDGSTDESLKKIMRYYKLVKVNYAYSESIKTGKIRAIYKSTNQAYAKLLVIDKENGGKADSLNAGINISRSDLLLAIDVDCIIESDAVLKMVKPFLEESKGRKVIASGGVVRVANSCKIEDGRVLEVSFPKNIWARFQVLEYFRAFTLGRMAWSKINGLLIISGAFGLFDKKIVKEVGGYDSTTVGEDLELVVRMRKYMHEQGNPNYRVAFIPDPLCWTEVPSSFQSLATQRNRWTRGSIDTIKKHRNLFFNPKYKKIGMISFPYWVLFEWFAPILESIGIVYFLILLILGMVNMKIFLVLSLFVFTFSLSFSTFAVLYETYVFSRYRGKKFILQVIFVAMSEMLFFHPLTLLYSLKGNYDFFIKKNKKSWGNIKRTAFDQKKDTKSMKPSVTVVDGK